jgi:hypothetical protein
LQNPANDIAISMRCPHCGDVARKHFRWFRRHMFYGCRNCRRVIEVHPGYRDLAGAYEKLVEAANEAFGKFFDE